MKKRLLIITDVMGVGGVEKVIVNCLKGLDYSLFEVTLLIMYRTNNEINNIKKIPSNVEIKYIFQKPVRGQIKRLLYYLLLLLPGRITRKIIINKEYDIVVSTKDVFNNAISTCKNRKITWIHGGLEHLENEDLNLIKRCNRLRQKLIYNRLDSILVLTNSVKSRFDNAYRLKEKTFVLNNPIYTNEIIELSREEVSDYIFGKGITLICCCRLSVEKGLERFLKCCNSLLKEGFQFNVLIIGDGPEKGRLMSIVNSNILLEKRVDFLGFRDNPFKYINHSSIYISTSFTEGFPLSIAEAIILGIPVLSTDCNGAREMLGDGKYGVLVENSELGIYNGLKKLLLDERQLIYFKERSKERGNYFNYNNNILKFQKYLLGG